MSESLGGPIFFLIKFIRRKQVPVVVIARPGTKIGTIYSLTALLCWKLRVFLPQGFSYYKYHFGRKILESKPTVCDKRLDWEVHILTCQRDFIDAIWALKTFYHFSGLRPLLVIHDDGSLKPPHVAFFKSHFKNCVVISREKADRFVKEKLRKYPACFRYRFTNFRIHAIKLFDFYFLSRKKSIFFLDSDVLFFRKPSFIIDSIKRKKGFFMSDYQDTYCIPRRRLDKLFGINMRKKVNSGLIFFPKKHYNMRIIEAFLERVFRKNLHRHMVHRYWFEQTALAIIMSKYGKHFLRLPEEYQISRKPITEDTVSNHFVSDGSRPLFYTSGLKRLEAAKILEELSR